ncbi:MAG: hypothetical protein GY754_22745 [bacterium]|nr:hypothetical protein [bacterium]
MDDITRTILILMALIAACILYIVGIRNIDLQSGKRYGVFSITLMLCLNFFSCDPSQPKDPVNSVETEAESKRIVKLNSFSQWKKFKALWKKLDRVEPTGERRSYWTEYNGALDNKKREAFLKELAGTIKNLKTAKTKTLISPMEIEFLENVCRKRIEYLSLHVPSHVMIMHYMPTPIVNRVDNNIMDLERRIDTLIDLKKRKVINKRESRKILANIQKDARVVAIEQLFQKGRVFRYKRDGAGLPVQLNKEIKRIKKKKDQSKEYQKYYTTLLLAVKAAKEMVPSFNELIADLEK